MPQGEDVEPNLRRRELGIPVDLACSHSLSAPSTFRNQARACSSEDATVTPGENVALEGLEQVVGVLVKKATNVRSKPQPLKGPRRCLEFLDDRLIGLPFVMGVLMEIAAQKVAQIGIAIHVHGWGQRSGNAVRM